MVSDVHILAAGPDTVYLNVYPTNTSFQMVKQRISPDLATELDMVKRQAQLEDDDVPTRFTFDGRTLLMKDKGGRGFQWILENKRVSIAINRGGKMALLAQVRLSSEYLWAYHHLSLGEIVSMTFSFLVPIFGEYLYLQISALDLAVDVLGVDYSDADHVKESFISRAQLTDDIPIESCILDGPDRIKRRWKRITGLPFGARNAQVSALIYDKKHEIKYHTPEKEWVHDVWRRKKDMHGQPVWDGEQTVWRHEIRLRRQALDQMAVKGVFHGIDNALAIDQYIPGLWAYAVGHVKGGKDGLPDGWLRYVIPSEDTNRSRWSVHPAWKVIQAAFQPDLPAENAFMREEREKEELLTQVDEELAAHPWEKELLTPEEEQAAASAKKTSVPAPALPGEADFFDLRPFIRKRKYQVNQRRAKAAIAGWASTWQAWDEILNTFQPGEYEIDLSVTFHRMYEETVAFLEEQKKDFTKMVQKKRVRHSEENATAAMIAA